MLNIGIVASQITEISKTEDPEILMVMVAPAGTKYEVTWDVYNSDNSTVDVYSEINDGTPDVLKGSVLSGDSISCFVLSTIPSGTIYASAIAPGKTSSNVVAVFYGGM